MPEFVNNFDIFINAKDESEAEIIFEELERLLDDEPAVNSVGFGVTEEV
jgi:hypothetical protein